MKRPPLSLYVLAPALAFCLLLCSPAAWASTVRIGLLAWLDASEAEIQWGPMLQALRKKLPQHHIEARPMDLARISDAIAKGELDFVVTNPGQYVTLEAQHGITRIATQVSTRGTDPAQVVGSAVVALSRRDDLQDLAQLRGKTLAAVSPDAFGGYQIAWAELKRKSIDPERGDVRMQFTGFPMFKVLQAVADGSADAGVIRGCLLEQLERQGSLEKGRFRILSPQSLGTGCQISSATYPGWAFAATRETSPALSREVLFALLSLPHGQDVEQWTVPADYQPVHQMLRELQIGPYHFLRESSLESLARRYWPVVTTLFGILVLWLLYTLRVEHLIHHRTRELSLALQEREQLQTRMRTHQQQMDHLSRLSILGELSGTLAHELNQPLAAIGNYARSLLLRQNRGKLTPEAIAQAAEEIADESQRAAGILAGIRAFAKKRANTRENHHVVSLVNDALSLFSGMLPQTPDLQLQNKLTERQWVWIDPLQIQQVLLNLLKNAYDAHGSTAIDTPIIVRLSDVSGRCQIEIEDHGPGLKPGQQDHLFEPFFTTKEDGMGLGLSICKTIVEAHGGTLLAHANANHPGMTFAFSLPWQDLPPHPPVVFEHN